MTRLPLAHPGARSHPRKFARVESAPRIKQWWREAYREATGDDPPSESPKTWWKIFEFLSVNPQLRLADLELYVSGSRHWHRRDCRTPRERMAYLLAELGKHQRPRRYVYLLPRRGA